jgi:hypothetical protein
MKKTTEIKSIPYPISTTEYVNDWTEIDIVREIWSNGKDAGNVTIKKINNDLVITDDGAGMNEKCLIMGVSRKTNKDQAIGQFGEGLKLAFLVGMRQGIKIQVHSNDLILENDSDTLLDETILKINYYHVDQSFPGTKVTLKDWNYPTYADRFLNDNNKIMTNYNGSILNGKNDCIFVKDVLVSQNNGFGMGYNLTSNDVKMNRDRKSIDLTSCYNVIGKIMEKCENESIWREFWKCVKNQKSEKNAVIEYYNTNRDIDAYAKKTFENTFGDNCAIVRDESESSEIRYRGYTALNIEVFSNGLLPYVTQFAPYASVILDKFRKEKIIRITSQNLNDAQKFNLSILRKIARRYGFDPKKIFAGDLSNHNAAGLCDLSTGNVYIDAKSLNDLENTVHIFYHEVGHSTSHCGDLTDGHVNAITRMAAKVTLSYTIGGKHNNDNNDND